MRFSFDVADPNDAWALHCSLALGADVAAWWMALALTGEQPLLVRDESLPLPRRGSMEVRGPGLWADVHRHDADRWQVNFEGIALRLDANDVGRHEVGDLVPVEFEFEWQATGPSYGGVQPCMVDGEAQMGTLHLSLSEPTPGTWRHA